MNIRVLAAAMTACLALTGPALAQPPSGFNHPIPNIPGKSVVAVVVNYAPGGKSPAHHHPPSAFITGYVLEGAIRTQVDDGPVQVLHAGESFTENPGAFHRISENASATEPAKLLAIFVVDSQEMPPGAPAVR